MKNFKYFDLLEAVELWALDQVPALISSEEELSERFDQMVADMLDEGAKIDTSDTIAMIEWFNDWTDSLAEDGELHPEQLNCYEYIGKYS